jgi:hypothetical protein
VNAASLSACLPEGVRASPNVQKGIEIDVATFGNVMLPDAPAGGGPRADVWQPSGGVATFPSNSPERWRRCWFTATTADGLAPSA